MKLYIVSENGGQYEDFYDIPRAVCKTKELAQSLQSKLYLGLTKSCKISEEKWEKMWDDLNTYELENENVDLEDSESILLKLFPEYTLKDIEEAMDIYDRYPDNIDFDIKEIDYVECDDDIMKMLNGLRD